jgi:hypothetical protein
MVKIGMRSGAIPLSIPIVKSVNSDMSVRVLSSAAYDAASNTVCDLLDRFTGRLQLIFRVSLQESFSYCFTVQLCQSERKFETGY